MAQYKMVSDPSMVIDAIEFTGDNAAEVLELVGELARDNDGTLEVRGMFPESPEWIPVPAGAYVAVVGGQHVAAVPAEHFLAQVVTPGD